MNTTINNIKKILESALAEIVEVNHTLVADANAQRKEMRELLERMAITKLTISDLCDVYQEVGEEMINMAEEGRELAGKIIDAIDDPLDYCPICDYDDFVGVCENCGAQITANSDYSEEDGLLCNTCSHSEE